MFFIIADDDRDNRRDRIADIKTELSKPFAHLVCYFDHSM